MVSTGPGVTGPGSPAGIASPNNPNSLILGLVTGMYEFTWTSSNGGCDYSDAMLVTIVSAPSTANAGPDQTLPQFSNVTLAATPIATGIGTWTQESGPTTVTFIDENDAATFVAGTDVGVYEFRWTASNGICPTSFDIMQVTIQGAADLELTKLVLPVTASPGSTVTFTISIFNNDSNGFVDATGVEVEDMIPPGFTLVNGTISNSGVYNPGNFTITWSGLSIPLATTLNLTFDATVNVSGPYLNTAEITASDQAYLDSTVNNNNGTEDDQDTATFTVIGDTDGDGTYDDVDPDPADPCVDDGVIGDEDITNPIWQAADCDGDGVTNGQEILDGTDPYDFCDYDPLNQDYTTTSTSYQDADCDGDGVTNGDEIDPDNNGIDEGNGTDPFDPCDYVIADQTLPPTGAWNDADCDGDGVTNGDEVISGTDPANPCDYNPILVTLPQSTGWLLADCDGDGTSNGQEEADGTDPLDPCDVLIQTIQTDPGLAIDDPVQIAYEIWAAADCDGDGETNEEEATNGTDPYDPCDVTIPVAQTDPMMPGTSEQAAYDIWAAADCDGDGESNGTEVTNGTDPFDPCSVSVATIPNPGDPNYGVWAAADCDGDGETNGEEATNGTDPYDPCDVRIATVPVNPNLPGDPLQTAYDIWAAADCDGDGVTNGVEVDEDGDGINNNGPNDTNPFRSL